MHPYRLFKALLCSDNQSYVIVIINKLNLLCELLCYQKSGSTTVKTMVYTMHILIVSIFTNHITNCCRYTLRHTFQHTIISFNVLIQNISIIPPLTMKTCRYFTMRSISTAVTYQNMIDSSLTVVNRRETL